MATTPRSPTAPIHATSIDDFDVGQVRLPPPNTTPTPTFLSNPTHPPHPRPTNQVIGRGGFGLVYRARHRATGQDVALKVLDKCALHAEGMAPRVLNEVRLHARVASPLPCPAVAMRGGGGGHRDGRQHIVALRGFFEDDRSVYLVLEHCPKGDMYRFLKRHGPLPPGAAAAVMAQATGGSLYS
jgi:serine/threonine protein kinase